MRAVALALLLGGCGASAPGPRAPATGAHPFGHVRVVRPAAGERVDAAYAVHPTIDVAAEDTSRVWLTDSTAAWDAVRAALHGGWLPVGVRTEEIVNAHARPDGAASAALFPSPTRRGHDVLAIAAGPGVAPLSVRFEASAVRRWRLMGYEGRTGVTAAPAAPRAAPVVVLYEVALAGGAPTLAWAGERALRPARSSLETAPAWARDAWLAATFAEKLRGSWWARTVRYEDLARWSGPELRGWVERAAAIDRRVDPYELQVPVAQMDFDEVPGGAR